MVVYMSKIAFENKMESWEECLRGLPQRLKAINEKPPLRHGKPYAIVSDISEQYYCEMKVEMELRYGRAETEMKRKGEEIHEELLSYTSNSRITSGPPRKLSTSRRRCSRSWMGSFQSRATSRGWLS
jgi:hypothetical protein